MAIGYAHAGYIQRSRGGDVIRSAAYNAREAMRSERTGEQFDWRHKQATREWHEVIVPVGAEKRFADAQALWNAVDAAEKRRDGVTAREIILALPRDVSIEDRIELAHSFAEEHFVSKGLAVQIDIHRPHIGHDGQNENPHAHILVSTRRVMEDGSFDRLKAKELETTVRVGHRGRPFVADGVLWGDAWAAHQQRYFDKHGIAITVDPPHPIPGKHLGPGHIRNPNSERAKDEARIRAANEAIRAEAEREPVDDLARDLYATIVHALGTTDPAARAERIIDGLDRALYINDGAPASDLALRLHRVIMLAGAADDPEQALIRGTTEALRRHEARRDPRYNQPLAAVPEPDVSRETPTPEARPEPEPPPEVSPERIEQLHKDARADQVASDHRRLTIEDIAAELSPQYKQARDQLRNLTWERRTARSGQRYAEADREAGEHRIAERRREIGWLRSAVHDIRMPGQRWNEVKWWQDIELHNWQRLKSGGEHNLNRRGVKVKLADDRTERYRRQADAAFNDIRSAAEKELRARQDRALAARVALEEMRILDAEYVEARRHFADDDPGGGAMRSTQDKEQEEGRTQAQQTAEPDAGSKAAKLAELARTREATEREIENGRSRDRGRD